MDVLAVDDDVAVAEHARGKHRQRHERQLLGGEAADEFRARHFGGVEFEPAGHAVEISRGLSMARKLRSMPSGSDLAGVKREHAVIEAAGKSHRQSGH